MQPIKKRTGFRLAALASVAALVAVPMAAVATSHSDHAPEDPGAPDASGDGADNGTAQRDAAEARVAELRAAREAALASFHENRSAILEEYRASLNATRESYLVNKTRVIGECRGDTDGIADAHPSSAEGDLPHADALDHANMTEEEREAFAHCVRDGLTPLKDEARASMESARETALGDLKSLIQAKVSEFRAERDEVNARYGHSPEAPADSGSGEESTGDETSG